MGKTTEQYEESRLAIGSMDRMDKVKWIEKL